MCSEHCNLPDVSFVSIDDVYSSQIAVNYLLSIGRSRIALINSQLTNAYARFAKGLSLRPAQGRSAGK